MRRPSARLAAACALAAATAVFTGTALADPGNGNSADAPGQVNQEQAAQPQAPQPSVQQQQAPGQVKKAQVKQAQTSGSSTQAGVKPSAQTAHSGEHPSHTTAGASPDVSKRYGNGKTAAQIAHSRGAPDSQPLTGPGNSQPHKTYDCAHKDNKSGGVDVHAIKSYDTSCTQTQPQASVVETHVCGQTALSTTSTQVVGVLHGKSTHLMTNTHSAHFTKHADTPVTATVTKTEVVPTGENCSSVATSTPSTQGVQTQQTLQSAFGALPATQGLPSAAAPAAGGVLGAQTTLATPKPASHGGVLGTVARVTGASLPFTGFPVWVAILIALALIGGGLLVRRRATSTR